MAKVSWRRQSNDRSSSAKSNSCGCQTKGLSAQRSAIVGKIIKPHARAPDRRFCA
ncbi:Uncharacterised protein [Vibrio cholerae]|nr:Uncharacterised protein [Vibrio cholerae]